MQEAERVQLDERGELEPLSADLAGSVAVVLGTAAVVLARAYAAKDPLRRKT